MSTAEGRPGSLTITQGAVRTPQGPRSTPPEECLGGPTSMPALGGALSSDERGSRGTSGPMKDLDVDESSKIGRCSNYPCAAATVEGLEDPNSVPVHRCRGARRNLALRASTWSTASSEQAGDHQFASTTELAYSRSFRTPFGTTGSADGARNGQRGAKDILRSNHKS